MSEYIVRETGYPGTLKQEIVGGLVRCKDCKWSHMMDTLWGYVQDKRRYCESFADELIEISDEDFCSRGERKDDEPE